MAGFPERQNINRTQAPASCLCVLSPGVLGPQYFKDMAVLLSAATPDRPG
jgi:hypothetical protein